MPFQSKVKAILDKLSNSEVSSDKGSSSKSLEAIKFPPEMIKSMRNVLKMDTISLQIKSMCNGSRNFILIIFHLVSNNYCVYIVLQVIFFLDMLNSGDTDSDSTSTETSNPKAILDKLSNSEVSSDKGQVVNL